jgi:hypothetical protein
MMRKVFIFALVIILIAVLMCACDKEEEPIVATQIIQSDGQFAGIDSYYADQNVSNYSGAHIFSVGDSAPFLQRKRGFINFDLSSIPKNAVITDVQLFLRQNASISTALSMTFDLYRVTGAIDYATVTWNTQPTVESTPTITGLTCPYITESVWRNWTVTDLIVEMIANSVTSIMLRSQTEPDSDREQAFIGTYEEDTVWLQEWLPYLEITYTLPAKVSTSDGAINGVAKNMVLCRGLNRYAVKGLKAYTESGWKKVF